MVHPGRQAVPFFPRMGLNGQFPGVLFFCRRHPVLAVERLRPASPPRDVRRGCFSRGARSRRQAMLSPARRPFLVAVRRDVVWPTEAVASPILGSKNKEQSFWGQIVPSGDGILCETAGMRSVVVAADRLAGVEVQSDDRRLPAFPRLSFYSSSCRRQGDFGSGDFEYSSSSRSMVRPSFRRPG